MATLKGIDVSRHNGVIDWNKAKVKIDFAILRAGFGKLATQKDTMFEYNYTHAKSAGVPIGAYWYSYAKSESDAKLEAQACLSALKGKQFEFPIYYDIEESQSLATADKITKAFGDMLEKAGYFVGIYSSKSGLEHSFSDATKKKYTVWVAHVGHNGEPLIQTSYKGTHDMWQYSWVGSIAGISGDVDTDYCYKDFEIKIKKLGLNGFSKSAVKQETFENEITAGKAIKLKNVSVYASSTDKVSKRKLNGTYYLYDGKKINNRYRITAKKGYCNKAPVDSYVTGWINESEVK